MGENNLIACAAWPSNALLYFRSGTIHCNNIQAINKPAAHVMVHCQQRISKTECLIRACVCYVLVQVFVMYIVHCYFKVIEQNTQSCNCQSDNEATLNNGIHISTTSYYETQRNKTRCAYFTGYTLHLGRAQCINGENDEWSNCEIPCSRIVVHWIDFCFDRAVYTLTIIATFETIYDNLPINFGKLC